MKKIIGGLLAFILIVGGLYGYIAITEQNALGYISVDINPSVQFVTNNNNEVVNVIASNEDGEIILKDEVENLLGLSVEEAVEKIVELAIQYGYLDPEALQNDPNAVTITTMLKNKWAENRMRERVANRVENYFKNNGIYGVVLTNIDMEEIIVEAEELGVSVGHLKLIKSVLAVYSEKTQEELLELSTQELINLLKETRQLDNRIEYLEERIIKIQETLSELTDSLTNEALTEDEIAVINEQIADLQDELTDLQETLSDYETHLLEIEQQVEQKRTQAQEKYENWMEHKEERAQQVKNAWKQFKNNLTDEQIDALKEYFSNAFQNR